MRPKRCPSVRATLGRRCGPITISATTAMTSSSEKPISNIGEERGARKPPASHLRRRFLLDLALDGLAGGGRDLRLGLRGLVVFGLHSVLEALHRAADILADVGELLGAKDEYDHQQDYQPVPDAE